VEKEKVGGTMKPPTSPNYTHEFRETEDMAFVTSLYRLHSCVAKCNVQRIRLFCKNKIKSYSSLHKELTASSTRCL
jgi:hypothetical protein